MDSTIFEAQQQGADPARGCCMECGGQLVSVAQMADTVTYKPDEAPVPFRAELVECSQCHRSSTTVTICTAPLEDPIEVGRLAAALFEEQRKAFEERGAHG